MVIAVAGFLTAAKYGWPFGLSVLGVGWLAHSWLFPWRKCWKCGGQPANFDASGRNYNIWCWACGSTGKRRRWGSLLLRGGFGRL